MSIKKTIGKDLSNETSAKHGYQHLAKELRKKGKKEAARIVIGISKDERDHHKKLTKIRKSL